MTSGITRSLHVIKQEFGSRLSKSVNKLAKKVDLNRWIPTKKKSKLEKKGREQVREEFENPAIDPEEDIERRHDKNSGGKAVQRRIEN